MDLREATEALLQYARRHGRDMEFAIAGMLVKRAWGVLANETILVLDAARAAAPPTQPPDPTDPWTMLEDNLLETYAVGDPFTTIVTRGDAGQARGILTGNPLHPPPRSGRRVTLMELVQALEDARKDAERRERALAARRASRNPPGVERSIVEEDEQADIARVLTALPTTGRVDLRTLARTRSRADLVGALKAVLHLRGRGVVHVDQEDFPYGPVLVARIAPTRSD